jgi:hypothetical protein
MADITICKRGCSIIDGCMGHCEPDMEQKQEAITHDQAQQAIQKLVNGSFHQEPLPTFCIAARETDDDLVASRYVGQQREQEATHLTTIEAQAKTIEAMREALEFYADPTNHLKVINLADEDGTQCGTSTPMREDCGEKARSALALTQPEKPAPSEKQDSTKASFGMRFVEEMK